MQCSYDEPKRYVYENIKLGTHKPQTQKSYHQSDEAGDRYDPTIRILLRIMKAILENEPIIRTTLALKAHVNYTILVKHLDWLEKRDLVELFVEDGKICVRLSTVGAEFAYRLSGIGI